MPGTTTSFPAKFDGTDWSPTYYLELDHLNQDYVSVFIDGVYVLFDHERTSYIRQNDYNYIYFVMDD